MPGMVGRWAKRVNEGDETIAEGNLANYVETDHYRDNFYELPEDIFKGEERAAKTVAAGDLMRFQQFNPGTSYV